MNNILKKISLLIIRKSIEIFEKQKIILAEKTEQIKVYRTQYQTQFIKDIPRSINIAMYFTSN